MKKVLIIGYLHPFTAQHKGSFRPLPLAKQLPEFGWQPIVLTGPLTKKTGVPFRVVETPYHDILAFWKKLFRLNPNAGIGEQLKKRLGIANRKSLLDFFLTFGEEIFYYPDSAKGWKPLVLKAGEELLQREDIEAIISCHPVTSHLVASDLKTRHNIPWIADFADLWSQNHDYHYSPLRRVLDRRLELKTLSQADALVTVSEPWAGKLRALHKGKPVYTITHGFDPEEVNIPPASLTSRFTITYTGAIYTGKQDPTKLFAALRDLISDKAMEPSDIEVRFYGTGVVWLEREINRYGLSSVVKHYEHVPKEVAVGKQRESQLLLLLDWDDQNEKGVFPGKVFEYLGARRPILTIGGSANDVVHKLLTETKAGIPAKDAPDIKRALAELYQEYKLRGGVAYNGMEGEINKYSHREMARKFAEILDQLTANIPMGS